MFIMFLTHMSNFIQIECYLLLACNPCICIDTFKKSQEDV